MTQFAYLFERFPSFGQTFCYREVAELARQGVTPTDDPRQSPGTFHPLVYVHPETGRRALYLGRRRNAYVEGLSLDESNLLLDESSDRPHSSANTCRRGEGRGDVLDQDHQVQRVGRRRLETVAEVEAASFLVDGVDEHRAHAERL